MSGAAPAAASGPGSPRGARSRARWLLFTACAALVAAALAWTTDRAVTLEDAGRRADAEMRRQEQVRLALWRMDTAMSTLLAREGARPWTVGTHAAFGVDDQFDDDRVRARFLTLIGTINPLVTRSPRTADDAAVAAAVEALGATTFDARVRKYAPAIEQALTCATNVTNVVPADAPGAGNGSDVNFNDRQQRLKSAGQNAYQRGQSVAEQQLDLGVTYQSAAPAARLYPGPLVPVWMHAGGRRLLAFGREVRDGVCQGFVLDWDVVRASLLDEIRDALPGADLRPVDEAQVATDETGLVLATAPARFDPPPPATDAGAGAFTPTRIGLAVAWAAVLASLAASALLLRATVADADRRARFASSVTHELRTPLTTFRLYSEMLADGMVTDPAKRQEYLATLKGESARLASLVENVLSYARVEEGRTPRQRERTTVADLVDRCAGPLRRRADEAGMTLVVRVDSPGAEVVANADAVGQVLANLVDNACKYAAAGTGRTIELTVGRVAGPAAGRAPAVAFRVRDHGPGLAPENVAAAFTPFERGNRPPGDAIPGIGLGLALSRGLARDHGGDLVHEVPDDGPGAAFVLTLPAA